MIFNFDPSGQNTATEEEIPPQFQDAPPDESAVEEQERIANRQAQKINSTELKSLLQKVPDLLQRVTDIYYEDSEKTIALYGSMTCLGALLTNGYGLYDNRRVYPSLYTGVIAPPASNKGVVNDVRKMLERVHEHFKQQSLEAQKNYKRNIAAYKANLKEGTRCDEPEAPPYQVVIVSGDITAPKLIMQMMDNQRNEVVPSIIIEDEIEALEAASRGEHGKAILRMIRNAYHHATLSQQLKSSNQHYEVKDPILSVLLAGTHNQMRQLVGNSIENGLFSRFTIITLNDGPKWKDVSPCDTCPDRELLFSSIANDCHDFWQKMRSGRIEIRLRPHQWRMLNIMGSNQLHYQFNLRNELLAGVVKRHGLMAFKFCMILTSLRFWEANGRGNVLYCTDDDFTTALLLAQHSLCCSMEFFSKMPNGSSSITAKKKETFLMTLPNFFTRSEAIIVAMKMNISERQADRHLGDFVSAGLLVKVRQGEYEKTDMAKWQNDNTDEI